MAEEKETKQATIDNFREAIENIQKELLGCVGELVIADGYLEEADPLMEDPSYYIPTLADMVHNSAEAVKKALKSTYGLL